MKPAVRRISSSTSTSNPGAAGIPPTSTMSAPSAMTWSTRAIAALSSQVRPGRKNESGVLLTIPMISGCDSGNVARPSRSGPWARGPAPLVIGRSERRPFMGWYCALHLMYPACLIPHELPEVGCGGRAAGSAPVGHRQQLGCHQGEVMIRLVAVGARAEVNLRDGVESLPGRGVHQGRQLHAV